MKHVWAAFVLIGITLVALTYGAFPLALAMANRANLASSASATEPRERLYFATGEYDCKRTWDSIIRIDDISGASNSGTRYTPTASIPVKQLEDNAGLALNFAHNIYVDETRDEMYVASLFTGISDTVDYCDTRKMDWHTGSVAVVSNISQADGSTQRLSRHLYGDETGLEQPHGIWLNHSTQELYIANTHGGNILVYENAHTADGNKRPDRIISSTVMSAPTHIYIDEEDDRMFVTNFSGEHLRLDPGTTYPDDGTLPSVLIFDNASEISGTVQPNIRIVDDDGKDSDPTRLREGIAHITHNVWYDRAHNLIFVVHHTNEVLIFDLERIGQSGPQGCDDPQRCAMPPKAIIEVGPDTGTKHHSAYGLFYVPAYDRLYVTVGRTDNAPESELNYEIVPEAPPNVILAYDDVSTYESAMPTLYSPSRRIYWSSGHEDFPPQPIWVSTYYATFLPTVTR